MKITAKSMLLFSGLVSLPVVLVVSLFLPRYGEAVTLAERQRQAVVAKEVNSLVDSHVSRVYQDAVTVAAAVSFAAAPGSGKGADPEAAMRAVLATRQMVAVARIEIPSRKISTVLAKADNDAAAAPSSTEEMRLEVDEKHVSFRLVDAKTGIIVVPIPVVSTSTGQGPPPKGYLSVPLTLEPLQEDLDDLASHREFEQANIVVTDDSRHIVVSHGSWNLARGADGGSLPFFRIIPEGATQKDLGVQTDYEEAGEKFVASIVTVRELGWVVGISRPHRVAYADLYRLERILLGAGAGVLFFGLIVALFAARAVSRPLLALAKRAKVIGSRDWSKVGEANRRGDELGDLDREMVQMSTDLRTQEEALATEVKRRADLSRFMSQELVDSIIDGKHPLELGGSRRAVSVLFADVVAFTPLAETRDPEQVVALLNELFTVLTEVVFRHGGVVDKFIGDSIMAVFGAPVAQEDHASRALRTAEDMMRFLEAASAEWKTRFEVEVRLGVGVNSGEAIVGNVGSKKRMEYTVIGDVVNIAARLESVARPNQVLLGEATQALAGEEFNLRRMGSQMLSGRKTETVVYELLV